MTTSRLAVDTIRRLRRTVEGVNIGGLSRDEVSVRRSLRSDRAGLPGPIAVRDGDSAVDGILPFTGESNTGAPNMQWLPWSVVRYMVVGEGEYPAFLLSS